MKYLIFAISYGLVVSIGAQDVPRPPMNDFELAVSSFGQNLKIPLDADFLRGPDTQTKELYLNRGFGIREIIVFGYREQKWIGFRAILRPDMEKFKVSVDFGKIPDPGKDNARKIDESWSDLLKVLNDIKKDKAESNDSPDSYMYIRSSGKVDLVCKKKFYMFIDDENGGRALGKLMNMLKIENK